MTANHTHTHTERERERERYRHRGERSLLQPPGADLMGDVTMYINQREQIMEALDHLKPAGRGMR